MALRKARDAQALQAVSERVHEAAEVLKALSSDTRLKIMCAISAGELPVNKLAELTNQSQSAVSQHLTKLRAAGLVESRRDGQTIYYRCQPGVAQDIIDTLCRYYGPG